MPRPLTPRDRDEIARLYEEGASMPTIATRTKRSTATISKALADAGVTIRDRSTAIRLAPRQPRRLRSLHERLWEKIEVRGPDECWPFTGFRLFGYGRIGLGSREQGVGFAHRVVAEETYGPCPDGQQTRHLCGNRSCCNPAHLRFGTQSDNEADKVAHGLANRGERHGQHRLTQAAVRRIRELDGVMSYDEMACYFRVSRSTISDVVRRRTWSWLE